MNAFSILLAIYAALTLGALVRMRTATLIFAGNQLGVLRALSLIADFGQPRSQFFLPQSVFRPDNLEIAATLFALQALPLSLAVLWPESGARRTQDLPPLPVSLVRLLGVYFLLLTFSSRSILTHSYTDPERVIFGINLGGLHGLLASVALYEIVRRVYVGQWTPLPAVLGTLALFVGTDYSKGSTGLATGYVVTAAVLCFRAERTRFRRVLSLILALGAIVVIAVVVRGVRATAYFEGTGVVSSLARTLSESEENKANTAEGVEGTGNGVQYAAHVLACISLYEAGISREWRSIYESLANTFRPSFLQEPLGLWRPKEAAWELGDYYIHGGGIFVLGELYWNGGYPCVIIVLTALLWFCWRCDSGPRTGFTWLLILCNFAPSLLQGTGYGFSQITRGAVNGGIAVAIAALARRRWRSALQPLPAPKIGASQSLGPQTNPK